MDYVAESGTIDIFISDHQPVFIVKRKHRTQHVKTQFSGRTYRNYNQQRVQDQLDVNLDKNKIFNENDPSICCNYLLQDITKIADVITPIKEHNI